MKNWKRISSLVISYVSLNDSKAILEKDIAFGAKLDWNFIFILEVFKHFCNFRIV